MNSILSAYCASKSIDSTHVVLLTFFMVINGKEKIPSVIKYI